MCGWVQNHVQCLYAVIYPADTPRSCTGPFPRLAAKHVNLGRAQFQTQVVNLVPVSIWIPKEQQPQRLCRNSL